MNPLLLPLTDRSSPFLEAYRRIYRRILYFHKKDKIQVIGLTSTDVAEGKTLTCINLALIIAQDKARKVVLVDLDFRRPQVAGYLGLPPREGLADVIERGKALGDVMKVVGQEPGGLSVLPAGRLQQEIMPAFYAEEVAPLLTRLRNSFDLIIVDNPPILPLADEEFLVDFFDALLLVIRIGKTSKELVKAALESIGGKKITGLVLNGVEKQYSGYSYYGYYSKYHQRKKVTIQRHQQDGDR